MNILVSAVACNPFAGSEGAYGWRACRAIAKNHDVFIFTDESNRSALERARVEGLVPDNMHFRFLGKTAKCSESRMVARLQSWKGYIDFNARLLPEAIRWNKEVAFDLSHLVTFTTWRVGCSLWQMPLPLIWGPISGTEVFPPSCYRTLSAASFAFEQFRRCAGIWSRWNRDVRETAKRAAVIPVTHSQAIDVLASVRGRRDGVFVFCNVFFADQHIAQLVRSWPENAPQGPLRLFGSGNLEGRKGVAIALAALAILKKKGIPFTYTITSSGPELGHLLRLASRLGLNDHVSIGKALDRQDFFKTLQSSDIYFLPSLREGAGQTMMEAMLAGCAPLVADWCGPGEIVTDSCGIKIPVTDPATMTAAFATELISLNEDRGRIRQLGMAASKRIADNYNETTYLQQVEACYKMAKARRSRPETPRTA